MTSLFVQILFNRAFSLRNSFRLQLLSPHPLRPHEVTDQQTTNMAIFDKLECNVMIDGQPLPEYEVPSDEDTSGAIGKVNGPKIEKYIESRAGENFIVRVHLPKKYKFKRCDALKCTIYVDGKKIEVAVMLDDDMEEDGTNTMNHPGSNEFVNGEWILRKFRFSSLNIGRRSAGT